MAHAQRFYPDDPLWKEPPPTSVGSVAPRRLDNFADFYKNTFRKKGQRNEPGQIYPSQGTNTLDEAMDSGWYTNRHGRVRMSRDELGRGPDRQGPPLGTGTWTVVAAKTEGVTPGLSIQDGSGKQYVLKFDPLSNPEMATAADVIGSHAYYAFGYNVPENYIVNFRREQLAVKPGVRFEDRIGRRRDLRTEDIDELLALVPRNADGTIRAMASLYISGQLLGGFKYYKRRPDDPNELAPHEHLRVLRGLYVFAAWMNHTDAKALNSLDALVEENGRRFVKHYLIDFGASLGSDSVAPKDARLGHKYFIDGKAGAAQLFTLGFYVPDYARAEFPHDLPAVGNFEAEMFDADSWKANYPNAAFRNRLPTDEFWAAKQVMNFSDEDIRVLVHTGQFSDPRAEDYIVRTLIVRRDKIGRAFFAKLLPLDQFTVQNDRLQFTDLATQYQFRPALTYNIAWARFDNQGNQATPLTASSGPTLPTEAAGSAPGSYWTATIRADDALPPTTAYLRRTTSGWQVVGLDRGVRGVK